MDQDNIDILKSIKRVEAPSSLYHKIEIHIKERNRNQVIPLYKVSIAASLIFGLILSQFYVLNNFTDNEDPTNYTIELLMINDNSLYNE